MQIKKTICFFKKTGFFYSFAAQDLTRSKFNSKCGPTFSPSCAWRWAGG